MHKSYVPPPDAGQQQECKPPPPPFVKSDGSLHLHDGRQRSILLRSFTRVQMPLEYDEDFTRFVVGHVKRNTWEGYIRDGEEYNGHFWFDRHHDATLYSKHQCRLYASKINQLHQDNRPPPSNDSAPAFEYGDEQDGFVIGPETLAKLDVFVSSLPTCFGCFHREFETHAPTTEKNGYAPGPLFCPCSPRLVKWRHDNLLAKCCPEPCQTAGKASLQDLLNHCREEFDVRQGRRACPYHFAIYAFLVYLFGSNFPVWDHPLYQGIRMHPDRMFRRQLGEADHQSNSPNSNLAPPQDGNRHAPSAGDSSVISPTLYPHCGYKRDNGLRQTPKPSAFASASTVLHQAQRMPLVCSRRVTVSPLPFAARNRGAQSVSSLHHSTGASINQAWSSSRNANFAGESTKGFVKETTKLTNSADPQGQPNVAVIHTNPYVHGCRPGNTAARIAKMTVNETEVNPARTATAVQAVGKEVTEQGADGTRFTLTSKRPSNPYARESKKPRLNRDNACIDSLSHQNSDGGNILTPEYNEEQLAWYEHHFQAPAPHKTATREATDKRGDPVTQVQADTSETQDHQLSPQQQSSSAAPTGEMPSHRGHQAHQMTHRQNRAQQTEGKSTRGMDDLPLPSPTTHEAHQKIIGAVSNAPTAPLDMSKRQQLAYWCRSTQ